MRKIRCFSPHDSHINYRIPLLFYTILFCKLSLSIRDYAVYSVNAVSVPVTNSFRCISIFFFQIISTRFTFKNVHDINDDDDDDDDDNNNNSNNNNNNGSNIIIISSSSLTVFSPRHSMFCSVPLRQFMI